MSLVLCIAVGFRLETLEATCVTNVHVDSVVVSVRVVRECVRVWVGA
jgi:hypothetical protein